MTAPTPPAPLVPGRIGTPGSPQATRALLLGAGELGKEVALELARLGVEVAAADRYAGAPAMAVASRAYVIPMLDGAEIRRVVEDFRPHLIVPEIEAIHTPTLEALEAEGWRVVPTARAARLTMDREGIRRLAAESLELPTSPYRFADTFADYAQAVVELGTPCVVKPVMSSSGKGQSVVTSADDAAVRAAWEYAQSGGRTGPGRVIVEGFVAFDYEITLLTVRHAETGDPARTVTTFCPPVGHVQVDGDYRESWQPHPMSAPALRAAQDVAHRITEALGGRGLFGVELFVRGDTVLFSEVSPRPHDTGLVTLAGQELSEFALHARAILGLPIPDVGALGPAASAAILFDGEPRVPVYTGLSEALAQPGVRVLLFGKPEVVGKRRMGVALARGTDVADARARARRAAASVGRASD